MVVRAMSDLLLTFYGDDFTGSTDALEVITAAGLRSVLFTSPPTPDVLAEYPGVQAVGVAGVSRSLAPAEMERELRPAFAALRALSPRHLHYKVCSTFDSSPVRGNIGKAIEIGAELCPGPCVPLLVGNPALGRYCVFGNLFAQDSVAHDGAVYRLDRHPSASQHAITPMKESDLRVHLARQTDKRIDLFDVLDLAREENQQRVVLADCMHQGADVVLLDVLSADDFLPLGKLIDGVAPGAEPLFSVGSSGVEAALTTAWQRAGLIAARDCWPAADTLDKVLVVSGSCSPVTAGQIDWAITHGFAEIALEPCVLTDEDCDTYLLQTAAELVRLINSGKSVVVHSCRGKSDPRLAASMQNTARNMVPLENSPEDSGVLGTQRLGAALGRLVTEAVEQTGVRRVCVAGGDTASYATREMGIIALEMICPTVPGAPLCRVSAPGRSVDGIEICFKGGQVGRNGYFGSLLTLSERE